MLKYLMAKYMWLEVLLILHQSDLFERFDPMTNQWQILNPLPDNRRGIATASLNGKLYILGGNGGLYGRHFRPKHKRWESGVDLPSQFRFGAAINVGKKIFVVGGKNGNLDSNQTLYYSSSENNWTTVASG